MGGPCSTRFADIFMPDLEQECSLKLYFKPLFYGRYIDDIIAIVPKDKLYIILKTFNNYDSRLKFTHEIMTNYLINFLEQTVV